MQINKEKGFEEFIEILEKERIYDVGKYSFIYQGADKFLVTFDDNNHHFKATMNRNNLMEFIDECDDLRYSTYSGNLMVEGMTNLWNFYCKEDEFEDYMNELYGSGKWHSISEDEMENDEDGYYVVITTDKNGNEVEENTGIFYTDWYDSLSATEVQSLMNHYQKETEMEQHETNMLANKQKEFMKQTYMFER